MLAKFRPDASYAFAGAFLLAILSSLLRPQIARANSNVGMSFRFTGSSAGYTYSAGIDTQLRVNDPNPQDLQFKTAVISSADRRYQSIADPQGNGWRNTEPLFINYNAFLNSLQQPWTILLDAELPTERRYTMSLNVGDMVTNPRTPPVITFPRDESVIDTLTPTFEITPTVPLSGLYARLSHYVWDVQGTSISGIAVTDTEGYTAADTRQWNFDRPLLPATSYNFELYAINIFPQGFGFTDPTDALGNAIPGWSSRGDLTLASLSQFGTPLPEPTGGLLLVACAMALVRRRP